MILFCFARDATPGGILWSQFGPIWIARTGPNGYLLRRRRVGATPNQETAIRGRIEIMDETVQKSCWGVTAKAVLGFACVILIAWLIGGGETTAILASKQ